MCVCVCICVYLCVLLADVFVHICIGSDVNIICPAPNHLYVFDFTN